MRKGLKGKGMDLFAVSNLVNVFVHKFLCVSH